MKKFLLIYICLLWVVLPIYSQEDSDNTDFVPSKAELREAALRRLDSLNLGQADTLSVADTLRKHIYAFAWKIDDRFGWRTEVPVDTLDYNFQNRNMVENYDVAVNYLGTIGSPAESKIYFNRDISPVFMFASPYDYYIRKVSNFNFLNTKSPYTLLTYNRDLDKQEGEEHFNALFSVNVNKDFAFGGMYDLIYGRGYYNAQSTNHDQFALFGSYITDKYNAHMYIGTRSFLNYENGGITDDRYITDPQQMAGGQREYEPRNIPTHMTKAWSKLNGEYVFFNHHYNLGFYRNTSDSVDTDFVPVTSFIHTFRFERYSKRYLSNVADTFYQHIYLDSLATHDHTKYKSIKNTLAVSLLEGFNKYSKFGLAAFVEHDIRSYATMPDSVYSTKANRYATTIGAELSRKKGKLLTFRFLGELGIAGEDLGRFKVDGNIDTHFGLFGDTVTLAAIGSIMNLTPRYFQEHYNSNHFKWNNSFKDEQRVRFGGLFKLKKLKTELDVNVENITDYVYFNEKAMPAQHSDNIQVISAQLNQDFKLGILHLDNNVVWQKTSDQSVLPLPEITLYHNLYIQGHVFNKELAYQIGLDMRYHTEYYATSYMPATGQFYAQNEVKVGNYPLVNVYGNFHLKNVRFYVMVYHVNSSMGSPRYFIQPHYPMNPLHFKFGLAWNFHN